jgi:nitric oxide reductase NorD protein
VTEAANTAASSTARLYDHERALALFAQGVSGEYYHIKPAQSFSGTATGHQAGQPLHDRGVLYLPEEIDRFRNPVHNRTLYRLIALHQISFLEFGSYDFDIHEARVRSVALGALNLPEAGLPESDFETLYRLFPAPWLARQLFRMLEAARIDAAMLRRYPGARRDYERIAVLERDTRAPLDDIEHLADVVEALLRWTLGESAAQLTQRDRTGCLSALIRQASVVCNADAEVYSSADALACCYAILEMAGLAPPARGSGTGIEALDDEAATFELEPVAFQGDAPVEWLQRERRLADWREQQEAMDQGLALDIAAAQADEAVAGQAGGEASDGDTRPVASDLRQRQNERDTLMRRISIEASRIDQALGRAEKHRGPSFIYDEWDSIAHAYLRGWCRVYEDRGLDTDPSQIRTMLDRVAPHKAGVRRRFEQMKPFAYQRVHRIDDGEELDFDQLVDYKTERKRGQVPDDRVYSRRDRLHRDVAAAFLVDLSASTDDPIEKPMREGAVYEPDLRSLNLRDPTDETSGAPVAAPQGVDSDEPPRRIIDIQRESLLLMAQALEALGDPYAIYGFSGYGRDNVEFYIAKDFNDAFSYRTLGALAAMKPRRSTRMGPAIRHSVRKLSRAASALKVLIVISDGFPQDCDYGPDRADHGYGVEDTAKALEEAQRAGVETFCVTVDRSGHDYLKQMCPDARYMVIEEIEALPSALSKIYERLTGR